MRTIKNCMLSSETMLLSDAEMMSVQGGGLGRWIIKIAKKYGPVIAAAVAEYWAARACDETFVETDEEEIEVDYVYDGGELPPAYCYG